MQIIKTAFLVVLGLGVSLPARAIDDTDLPEVFQGHTPGSPIEIKYDDWSQILKITVTEAPRSDRSAPPLPPPRAGSLIVVGNKSSYRFEGNRLAFASFSGKNLDVVREIRQELEQIPAEVPFRYWDKTEQLTYWLNLHNVTLIEKLAEQYPIRQLQKLKLGSRKSPSLWDQKILTVAGVPVSLHDIQHKILPAKWKNSLVIYGLFQGYIGGPNIPAKAFTSRDLHEQLVAVASEFVNSNRGTKVSGRTLIISRFYKDNRAYFPDFNVDVKKHVMSLLDSNWRERVAPTTRVKAKSKDYYIADLHGGGEIPKSGVNTNSAALVTAVIHSGSSIPSGGGTFFESVSSKIAGGIYESRFPESAQQYLTQIRNDRAKKRTEVTLEEIERTEPNERVKKPDTDDKRR